MIKKVLTAVCIFGSAAYSSAQLTGGTTVPINGTQNPPSSFSTVANAASYLATSGVTGTGDVILELQSGYTSSAEPASGIYFDTIMGANSTRKVTLRPASGFSTSITGSVTAAGLINFRSTVWFTIDGRQGGSGSSGLTIGNTSTAATDSTSTIRFNHGTRNVQIRYCTIQGASKSPTNGGVILFGNTNTASGNNFITIENCNIDGTANAHNGICSNGTNSSAAIQNTSDTIRNNNIYDVFNSAGTTGNIFIRLHIGATGWTITGNSLYQTAARTYTVALLNYGIYTGAGNYWTTDVFTITNNYIGGSGPLATGTLVSSGGTGIVHGFMGIACSASNGSVISGNTIKNINVTSSPATVSQSYVNGMIYLISLFNGSATVTGNTIDSIQLTSTTGTMVGSGIHFQTQLDTTFVKNITPNFTFTNNQIRNITVTPGTSTTNGQVYGMRIIASSTANQGGSLYSNNTTLTISGNTIDGIKSNGVSASSWSHGIAIPAANGTNTTHFVRVFPTIINNTIRNISAAGAIVAVGYPVAGGVVILNAHTSNASYTDTLKIRGNTIHNIYCLNPSDINTNAGAIFTNLGRPDISRNTIYNIYNSAIGSTNSPYTYGVNVYNTVAASTITNNFISIGDTATSNQGAMGIVNPVGTNAIGIHYNSIIISGFSTTRHSAAILRGDPIAFTGNATNMTLFNNLLINRRTGSGNHAAMYFGGTSVFNSNNNTFLTTSSALVNFHNASAMTFDGWKTSTNRDDYSYYGIAGGSTNFTINPPTISLTDLFGNATFSSNANMQIDNSKNTAWMVFGKGTSASNIAVDINLANRSVVAGNPTTIGANEITTSTTPPNSVISGNIAGGDSSMAHFAGRELVRVYWGAGTLPSSVASKYYSGTLHPSYPSGNRSASYWTVAGSGGSGYSYGAAIFYGPHETGTISNSASTTKLAYFHTNGWNDLGAVSSANTTDTPQTAFLTSQISYPLTSNSAFALTDNVSPLPVQLTAFTGSRQGNGSLLTWTTASEINNDYFELQRSLNGTDFITITNVDGKGNNIANASYSYDDLNASDLNEKVLYYRLRQVDIDGQSSLSGVVKVRFDKNVAADVSIFPNPFTESFTLSFDAGVSDKAMVRLVDLQGRIVGEYIVAGSAGKGSVTIAEETMEAGVYHAVLIVDGVSSVHKIVKFK